MVRLVFAGIVCVVLSMIVLVSAADELYVDSVNGFSSLTEAVEEAKTGDLIFISPGIYTSETETFPIVIDKSITISAQADVFFEGPPFTTLIEVISPDVTIQNINFRFLRWGIYCTGDRLKVENCSFQMYDNTYRVSSCAIWFGGVYNCTVLDCMFEESGICIAGPPLSEKSNGLPVLTGLFEVGEDINYFSSHNLSGNTINSKPLYYFVNQSELIVPDDAGGLIAVCCDDLKISELDVSNNSMGIELAYCNNVTMSNVSANRCGIFGVYLAYCNLGSIKDVRCYESNHGIDVRACKNIGIIGCNTNECEQGVFLSGSTECLVDGCIINSCGNGMFVAAGKSNQFSSNIVHGNQNGIYVQNENDMLVCGNEIYGNTVAGVRFLRSTGYVLANTISSNQTGVLEAESDGFTLWGNTFFGNKSTALYLRDTLSGKISGNIFKMTENIFVEIKGSILNTLIFSNSFEGNMDKVVMETESDVLFSDNQWDD